MNQDILYSCHAELTRTVELVVEVLYYAKLND